MAHELPAELLADFIEQAGVPNAGIPFDFQPAVDARMVDGLTRDEELRILNRLGDALPQKLASSRL